MPDPMHSRSFVFLALLTLLAAGCGRDEGVERDEPAPVTAAPAAPLADTTAPDASALETAIAQYAVGAGGDPSTPYRHHLADLDGEGAPEALVLLEDAFFCGNGGCTMVVFRYHPATETYNEVSTTYLVNPPVRVGASRTNGWRDLLLPLPNTVEPAAGVLRFDGQRYPEEPEEAQPGGEVAAELAFDEDL
jgi:hypothetical protein